MFVKRACLKTRRKNFKNDPTDTALVKYNIRKNIWNNQLWKIRQTLRETIEFLCDIEEYYITLCSYHVA